MFQGNREQEWRLPRVLQAFPGDFAKSLICQNQFRQRRNRKSPQDFRLSGEGGAQRRMRFPLVALCASVLIDVVPAIRTSSVFRLNCKQFNRNPPRAYRPVLAENAPLERFPGVRTLPQRGRLISSPNQNSPDRTNTKKEVINL